MSSIVEGVRSLSATSFMRALTPITGTLFIKLKGDSGSSPLNFPPFCRLVFKRRMGWFCGHKHSDYSRDLKKDSLCVKINSDTRMVFPGFQRWLSWKLSHHAQSTPELVGYGL